ncbi:hypothetical protein OIV83_003409 [Microbotryomycetes sp. JL201]|nr:hypothetical protein OIV83_003409 [Microbotryomycetes sp. JL201]
MSGNSSGGGVADELEHNPNWQRYAELQVHAANLVRDAFSDRQQLLARIQELEAELQVWKIGHSSAVKDKDAAQRLVREYQGGAQGGFAACVLDGDGAIFDRQYIARGREGGREAAHALMQHVQQIVDSTDGLSNTTKVICNVWFNKTGLARVLQENGIAQEATFAAFVQGFNAAHPSFTMTDVGASKEAADAKFCESLRFFAKLPSCKLVFAGCSHDGGYSHVLQSLETEGSLGKVRVLKSFDDLAFEIKRLNLKMVEFPGLFESRKLSSFAHLVSTAPVPKMVAPTLKKTASSNSNGSSAALAAAAAAIASGATPKKLYSPLSSATPAKVAELSKSATASKPLASSSTPLSVVTNNRVDQDSDDEGFTRVVKKPPVETIRRPTIDPSKPLHKQNPPPCNKFYLQGECTKDNCQYEHQYRLTPKQITALRVDAKKSPCFDMLRGRKCPPDCIAGHRCPFAKCPFGGASGSCKFKAPGMHGEDDIWSTDDSE